MPIQPGGAGGFLVRSPQSALIGYLKPLNPNPQHPVAAYEKIASDLAYEVGVNVPPVVLHCRPNPPAPQPKEVAVSLVWGRSSVWSELFNMGAADGGIPDSLPALAHLAKHVLAEGSGVLALDAWLHNQDRNNARNALLAYDCGTGPGTMCYIDFGHTMDCSGSWTQGHHQVFARVNVPPFFATCVDRGRVRETAERIIGLSDAVVAQIVQRIPDGFLAAPARDRLAEWLVWRKQNLIRTWDQWYAGT